MWIASSMHTVKSGLDGDNKEMAIITYEPKSIWFPPRIIGMDKELWEHVGKTMHWKQEATK